MEGRQLVLHALDGGREVLPGVVGLRGVVQPVEHLLGVTVETAGEVKCLPTCIDCICEGGYTLL